MHASGSSELLQTCRGASKFLELGFPNFYSDSLAVLFQGPHQTLGLPECSLPVAFGHASVCRIWQNLVQQSGVQFAIVHETTEYTDTLLDHAVRGSVVFFMAFHASLRVGGTGDSEMAAVRKNAINVPRLISVHSWALLIC